MSASICLRNGTLLIHDEQDIVRAVSGDLLIEDGRIAKIGSLPTDIDCQNTVDCTGKLISPGFIDTHHHVWQSCLKATHADETLVDYFWSGNFVNSLLSPEDIFLSQLAGAMELVDSGTTTVVDHASLNYSTKHSTEAIRATIASGIRSVFAYCPTPRVASWKPEFRLEPDLLPPWVMDTYEMLAQKGPFGPAGRVRLGFAFDGLYLPAEQLQPLFAKVRKVGAQLITSHSVHSTVLFGAPSTATQVQQLIDKELIGSDILLSHDNQPRPQDTKALLDAKASISCTPSTELQMGHGNPVCLADGIKEIASLGVDCHSVVTAYLPAQMSLCLQWARGHRHEELEKHGQWAARLTHIAQDVYNLGTIQGARCAGLQDEVGSIAVGKKADLVIFDVTSPGLVVAAQRDPVAAIVLHSSVRDVEAVLIDGVLRKEHGRLVDVTVPRDIDHSLVESGAAMSWSDVSARLLVLAEEVDKRKREAIDATIAREGVVKSFYLNAAAEVE